MKKEDLIGKKVWYNTFEEGQKLNKKIKELGLEVNLEDFRFKGEGGIWFKKDLRIEYIFNDKGFFDGESEEEIFLKDILSETKEIESDNFKVYIQEEKIFIADGEDCVEVSKEKVDELIKLLKELK